MDDQNTASNNGGHSTKSTPSVESPEVVHPPETGQPSPGTELEEVKTELNGFERATLKWTRIVVGINLVTCVFIGLQFYEMQSGSSDTHALAVAANAQATEATAQVDKLSALVQQAAKEADAAADSARVAADSLGSSQKWSEISSRPYLQIAKVVIIEKPAAGKQIGVQWDMRNGGKSPAVDAECLSCTIFLEDNKGVRSFSTSYTPADLPASNISEEAPATLQVWTKDDIGESQVRGLENGGLSIYVKGQIQYGSVYSRFPYPPFKFCYFYAAGGWGNTMEPCITSSSHIKEGR